MFTVNDLVVYGNSGVCRINEIGCPEFAASGSGNTYYTLSPLYSRNSVIYCPEEKAAGMMRPVLSGEEARVLIEQIPEIGVIEEENHRAIFEKFDQAIKSNDCCEWVRIIKTVHRKKVNEANKGKKVSQSDRRYMKQAEDLLYGELAVTLSLPKEEVERYIVEKVSEMESF